MGKQLGKKATNKTTLTFKRFQRESPDAMLGYKNFTKITEVEAEKNICSNWSQLKWCTVFGKHKSDSEIRCAGCKDSKKCKL